MTSAGSRRWRLLEPRVEVQAPVQRGFWSAFSLALDGRIHQVEELAGRALGWDSTTMQPVAGTASKAPDTISAARSGYLREILPSSDVAAAALCAASAGAHVDRRAVLELHAGLARHGLDRQRSL